MLIIITHLEVNIRIGYDFVDDDGHVNFEDRIIWVDMR